MSIYGSIDERVSSHLFRINHVKQHVFTTFIRVTTTVVGIISRKKKVKKIKLRQYNNIFVLLCHEAVVVRKRREKNAKRRRTEVKFKIPRDSSGKTISLRRRM